MAGSLPFKSRLPVTQLIAQATEEHLEHDVGGHLQEVEGGAGAFIEGPITASAAKDDIAEIGGTLQRGGPGAVAVRTVHEIPVGLRFKEPPRYQARGHTYNPE